MPHANARDGTRLYYEETGTGAPVVFVHEFAGDHRSWEPQVRHFSRRYRCIAYNARGYPPSDVPEDFERYSQARARDDIRAVLDAPEDRQARTSSACRWAAFATLHFGMAYGSARSRSRRGRRLRRAPGKKDKFQRTRSETPTRFAAEGMEHFAATYGHGPHARAVPEQGPARLRRIRAPVRRALAARRGEHACSACRCGGRRSTT